MIFFYPFLFSRPSHFFTWQINERSVGKTSRDSYEENYILDPPLVLRISHHVTGFCKSTQLEHWTEQETFISQPFVISMHKQVPDSSKITRTQQTLSRKQKLINKHVCNAKFLVIRSV